MDTLEQQLLSEFSCCGLAEKQQEAIMSLLHALKTKDLPIYKHSAQTGILSGKIARHFGCNPAVSVPAGTLHDIGKLYAPGSILCKTSGFTPEDRQEMKKHPLSGYAILTKFECLDPFIAQAALIHHLYQESPYPETLPPEAENWKNIQGLESNVRLLVALPDFYDALTTRVNDKFGEMRKRTPEEARAILLDKCAVVGSEVKELYSKGIFS
jgi:putative nucleotidyltransferase with HDIG domain